MYVAEGCDGSTAAMDHAANILALNGIHTWPMKTREMLFPDYNPFFPDDQDIVLAMQHLYQKVKESGSNQTLIFKSILHRDMEATTAKGLHDMGTLAVYVTRRNPLDQ